MLVPFDPTTIESIQLHVPASGTAQSYSFCISNLKMTTSNQETPFCLIRPIIAAAAGAMGRFHLCYRFRMLRVPLAGTRAVPRRDLVVRVLETFFAAPAKETANIAAAYLFGSVARDEAGPTSDVDVGVLYVHTPPATLEAIPAALESELTRCLGGVPTQVVVLDTAPIDLVHRVLRDGVLVCERDRSRRVAFEVRARNLYWDLLPVLRRYRRPVGPPP
jgi:predicted nucleotidyltransferase